MGEVVSLNEYRADPHTEGEAQCLDCGHTEQSVAPVGTTWMECSACGHRRMRWVNPVGAANGDLVYTCNCGCEYLILLTRNGMKGVLCGGCGANHTPHAEPYWEGA